MHDQGQEKPWFAMKPEEILPELAVTPRFGLSDDEAAKRLSSYGPNVFPEKKRNSILLVFLRQFRSPLIYLLLIAALGAFLLGETRDAAVIVAVLLINAIIGAFQEGKAERSMAALRQISSLKTRVLREGKEHVVAARELVPGDIILLSSGDAVGADARLLEVANLEVAEAALTGESVPVRKRPEPLAGETLLADRQNMVFAGTQVTSGRAKGVVVATGAHTEVGKIAKLTQSAEEPKTPLENRIAQFGRYLIYAAILLFFVIVGLGRVRGVPFTEIFMIGVSQVVSMIPEGLPVAVTVALSVGVQRMAARKTIVRRLSAVETLGSTSVICSDKTGTLTRNEMTVTTLYSQDGREIEVTGVGYAPEGDLRMSGRTVAAREIPEIRVLLEAAIVCNDAQLDRSEEKEASWNPVGDPTEVALLTLAMKGGLDTRMVHKSLPRIDEIPFDSGVKMMATQHSRTGRSVVYIKGAPEVVLDLCFGRGAPKRALEAVQADRVRIQDAAERMASKALRVLAFAKVEDVSGELSNFEAFRGKADFLGFVGQLDPPRIEVKDAVVECKRAGIQPVMVTGDHKATGWAIARSLGIAGEKNIAVDGSELEQMTDETLKDRLDEVAVFARVHPAQKLRIVEAYQSRNGVVAMTGDGVNDAPALARANVGVAMGITGTEVAKEAAKIVIADDNFATIVKAVEEGRLIYRNIKKLILYLFSTSASEILVLLTALLIGYPPPLVAVQILWINLVTDGAVTVTLIMEPPEGDEMQHRPIPMHESLLTRPLLRRIALMAPAIAVSTLGFFIYQIKTGVPFVQARTEAFTVLAVSQWFNVLNCRSDHQSVFRLSLLRNKWLMGGLIVGNVLHAGVIFLEPMNRLFHTVQIPLIEALKIGLISSLVLWVEEVRKFFARRRRRLRAASAEDTEL